jgi:hypothetical protein
MRSRRRWGRRKRAGLTRARANARGAAWRRSPSPCRRRRRSPPGGTRCLSIYRRRRRRARGPRRRRSTGGTIGFGFEGWESGRAESMGLRRPQPLRRWSRWLPAQGRPRRGKESNLPTGRERGDTTCCSGRLVIEMMGEEEWTLLPLSEKKQKKLFLTKKELRKPTGT